MKRSEINNLIAESIGFIEGNGYRLPPFATWDSSVWDTRKTDCQELKDLMLGWDITDFGGGDFFNLGLILFTVRNGKEGSSLYPKPYAEKIMIVREGQVTPMHFHWSKMEDIINRGGGNLIIEVYNSNEDESLDQETAVEIVLDGCKMKVAPGTQLILHPGESITIPQYLYHSFWGDPGEGMVLVGEVSKVNDDTNDNRLLNPISRFPDIEEDEEPQYLLCTDYE